MNKLFFAPEAQNDLEGIFAYISQELQSPSGARNTIGGILEALERLRDFSEMGASLVTVTGIESDYRFLVCGNYLAFYRVKGEKVYIDRVLYGKRDYLRILFGSLSENT